MRPVIYHPPVTKAQAGPMLRSQIVPLFLARLGFAGVDVDELRRRFRLPDDPASMREMDVPLYVVHELPLEAERLLSDPFIGLHLAETLPRGAYGLLEFIVRSSADLREAGGRLVRYHGLLNDLNLVDLDEGPEETVLTQRIPGEPLCIGRHANEFAIALIVRVIRESIGNPEWAPLRVMLAHPAPPDTSALLTWFRVPAIDFGRGANGIAVATRDLDLPVRTADAALLRFLDEQAMALIASKPADGDALWSRLREEIRVSLRNGPPLLEAIAETMGTSARTLQRRLSDRGASFQSLVEEIRKDLAIMYVEGESLSSLDVAFLLGYSDRRAFLRAFKRWTGTTPAEHRKRG